MGCSGSPGVSSGDYSGMCFDGDSKVLLEGNKKTSVRNLKRGDILNNGAMVECLVEKKITSSKLYMSNIDGVLLTRHHPILYKGKWCYPIEISKLEPAPDNSCFCLVLKDDKQKKFEVEFENGIKAITLAHYRKDNKLLDHPYYGTNAVLEDLKRKDPNGYKNGYVLLHVSCQSEIKKEEIKNYDELENKQMQLL